MHIKLVVNSFPTASETFLFNFVTGLEKRGIKVTVCATTKTEDLHLYAHRLNEWSGKIEYISLKPDSISKLTHIIYLIISSPGSIVKILREKGIKRTWWYLVSIFYLIKDKPDLIHFSFSGIGISYLDCLNYLKNQSVKLVVSCRGTAEKVRLLLEPDRKKKLKSLFTEVDLIHCVSKDMRDGLLPYGLTEKKTFINYPSIDTHKFSKSIRESSPIYTKWFIVTIGRLSFQKGYVYALQALKKLVEKNILFTYHIVGEGPDRALLTYLIQEWGLNDSVVMHGKVSSEKVLEILRRADVFLLPSLSEGVSNAALEAMAVELPIVSTRAGGMVEVITHGENGLLTDWRNPQHMAEQLIWLYENPFEAREMGKKAALSIKNLFSLDHQIDIFISQYKALLEVSKN